jgi:membrane-associated protease RseP (regulator of RpoE activity)
MWVSLGMLQVILAVYSAGIAGPASAGARPRGFSLDTIPADSLRLRPGGYTGISSGYWQTARIVGNTVVDPSDPMVAVVGVDSASPAARAGLVSHDVILEIDGVSIRNPEALERLTPGMSYVLRIRRGQDELEVTLVPDPPRPAAPRRVAP